MRICEICQARFRDDARHCPLDGGRLKEVPDPLLGAVLAGRYFVIEKLGQGGMGAVYRARNELVGRDVAVKFLAPQLAASPSNKERFLREARAANRIQHENVIAITDYGETQDGQAFLVMELLDGRPLSKLVARGPMTFERASAIGIQICRALARAHELDVVHRDVKPENVYVTERADGTDFVKILDFGLAHMRGELRLTQTGTVYGTPEYIAPEQARGLPITPAVDLYSLGVVLFEMLTGKLPFTGTTQEILMKHIEMPPPKPSSLAAVPAGFDDIVLRLLTKEPTTRYPSAHFVLEDLRRLRERERIAVRAAGSIMPDAPPSLRPARASAVHTRMLATLEWWATRAAVLRGLVARAHPNDPPPWISTALDSLDGVVRQARSDHAALDRLATEADERERTGREARTRVGRALDQLARDHANALREIEELHAVVRRAEIERARSLAELQTRFESSGYPRQQDPATLRRLVELGDHARAALENDGKLAQATAEVLAAERRANDLVFQLAELKKLLVANEEQADAERDRIRAATARVEAALRGDLQAVVEATEPLMRHFMRFPELKAVLVAERAPRSAEL